MRSRYDLAQESSTRGEDDSFYKDILTIPLDKFRYTSAPREYYLTTIDVKRLDLLVYRLYGIAEFDDLLLWINKIADPTTLTIGDKILVPSKTDIESFYYDARE